MAQSGNTTNFAAVAVDSEQGYTVNGTEVINSSATLVDAQAQASSTARTATSDGLTTGTIADGTRFVTVTSASANNIAVLPAPNPGTIVWLTVGATGYELRTSAPATVAINGGTGATAESAIGANVTTRCVCTSATTWVCNDFSSVGAVTATEVAA